jgi:hypothetical protein
LDTWNFVGQKNTEAQKAAANVYEMPKEVIGAYDLDFKLLKGKRWVGIYLRSFRGNTWRKRSRSGY